MLLTQRVISPQQPAGHLHDAGSLHVKAQLDPGGPVSRARLLSADFTFFASALTCLALFG